MRYETYNANYTATNDKYLSETGSHYNELVSVFLVGMIKNSGLLRQSPLPTQCCSVLLFTIFASKVNKGTKLFPGFYVIEMVFSISIL